MRLTATNLAGEWTAVHCEPYLSNAVALSAELNLTANELVALMDAQANSLGLRGFPPALGVAIAHAADAHALQRADESARQREQRALERALAHDEAVAQLAAARQHVRAQQRSAAPPPAPIAAPADARRSVTPPRVPVHTAARSLVVDELAAAADAARTHRNDTLERRREAATERAARIASDAATERQLLDEVREEQREANRALVLQVRAQKAAARARRDNAKGQRAFSAAFVSRHNAMCKKLMSSEISRLKEDISSERARAANIMRGREYAAQRARAQRQADKMEATHASATEQMRQLEFSLAHVAAEDEAELRVVRQRKELRRELARLIQSTIEW